MSQVLSSLRNGSVSAEVTSHTGVSQQVFATREIQGHGLGMIPEWRDACQFSVKNSPLLQGIEAIEIFHAWIPAVVSRG
jgi:hypothetical protein